MADAELAGRKPKCMHTDPRVMQNFVRRAGLRGSACVHARAIPRVRVCAAREKPKSGHTNQIEEGGGMTQTAEEGPMTTPGT